MAYVVATTFTTNPRAVVIRKKWIYQYSEAKNLNHGVNRNQLHSIFYSTDLEKEPDFNLEKRGFFEREPDATYDAKLIRFFDNCSEAIAYKMKHRHFGDGMPPVYNVNRAFEKPLPAILQGTPHQHERIADGVPIVDHIPEDDQHEPIADDLPIVDHIPEDDQHEPIADDLPNVNQNAEDDRNEPTADGSLIANHIAEGDPQHNMISINPPVDEGLGIGNVIALEDAQNNDVANAMPTNAAQIEMENGTAVVNEQHINSSVRAAEAIIDENNHEEVIVINEVIETIVIDCSDDDEHEDSTEPKESKLDIVPRVKIEDRDRTVIENIMSGGRNSSEPSGSSADLAAAQNQTTSAQQQQQATEEVAGPSGLNSNARASVHEPMQYVSGGIIFVKTPPKPRRAKLERDDFSGLIPYAQNEYGDRSYYYKFKVFSISSIFLGLLENMNEKNADEDIMFIKMLLVAFFGSENIATKVNADAEAFILRIFEVRVKNDKNRKEKFADFLKHAIEDINNGR